jgi:hypothetical protein
VTCQNILIPLTEESRDLKALHHAISLAERIESNVLVYSFVPETEVGKKDLPVIEASVDVIHRACENGLKVSFFIAPDGNVDAEADFLKLLDRENIDLVVISDTEPRMEQMIRKVMPLISCQIVQVRKKNSINYMKG